jgi:hypothetical protein
VASFLSDPSFPAVQDMLSGFLVFVKGRKKRERKKGLLIDFCHCKMVKMVSFRRVLGLFSPVIYLFAGVKMHGYYGV